jgi:hypothetical protein
LTIRREIGLWALVAGLALLYAAPVAAAPFTWLVQGTVVRVDTAAPAGPFESALHVGDNFDWWLTLDPAALDVDPSVDCGQYTPILSMAFQNGGASLSQPTMPGQDYLIKSAAYSAGSGCRTLVPPAANTARIRAGFASGLMVSMHLAGGFATDALPVDPSGLAPLGSFDFFYSGFDNPIANARVTSIRAIPEPAAATLLLGGLAALARRRRRRSENRARSAGTPPQCR